MNIVSVNLQSKCVTYTNRVQIIVLTPCSGKRNELISSSVMVYVYDVKCVVCE